jgi:hypothetical protein
MYQDANAPPYVIAIDIDIEPSVYTGQILRFFHFGSATKKLQRVFVLKGEKIIWNHLGFQNALFTTMFLDIVLNF